jgi:phospholipase D1/2
MARPRVEPGAAPGGREIRSGAASRNILVPGRNCWRVVHADRVAFLIDGAAYFEALAEAIDRAERSILLLGWDFHSRVRLRRRERPDADEELAARLDAAVRRRRRLRVYILEWDFAMIYALEREMMPLLRFDFATHRRVHFRLDDRHPVGASHHQKLVVVDDALAFCGGIDLAACRWDTSAHLPHDPRRSDPGFPDYGPFHDVQMAVDGEAARALGELARRRWSRTGPRRLPVPTFGSDPWPAELVPDATDVRVGIARTQPAYDDLPEVREVEQLFLDGIRAARRSLYFENQYFTASRVGDELVRRLEEPDGPEVVIVLPRDCSGWLETTAMGVLRGRLLRRLRAADRGRRLRVVHPTIAGLGDQHFTVHAKVMVVDDRLLRIGSANLANRSMGLDTECDLAVEAGEAGGTAEVIARFRDALLGEHLGVGADRVADAIRESGSLGAALDRLRGGSRSLEPLEDEVPGWLDELVPGSAVMDPERPLDFEALSRHLAKESMSAPRQSPFWRVALVATVVAALAAAWRWTPLGDWIALERLRGLAEALSGSALGPFLATGAFALAALLMVPVTLLIVATSIVYGWALGFAVAFAACMISAAVGYWAGVALWRDAVRRLAGRRLNRVSELLARRGVLSVVAARVVPIAPYTLFNLIAGASHVRFRDFMVGTAAGMAPGMVLLALLADQAVELAIHPGWEGILAVVAVAALLALGARVASRWLGGTPEQEGEPDDARG